MVSVSMDRPNLPDNRYKRTLKASKRLNASPQLFLRLLLTSFPLSVERREIDEKEGQIEQSKR